MKAFDLLGELVQWVGDNPRPALVVAAVLAIIVAANSYRPSTTWRDPQRLFSADQRAEIHRRAGGRCEHANLLGFRCRSKGNQADHVYPWSKGGPTTLGNGASLCAHHNRAKSDRTPSRLYVLSLERRRRRYFEAGSDTRVSIGGG